MKKLSWGRLVWYSELRCLWLIDRLVIGKVEMTVYLLIVYEVKYFSQLEQMCRVFVR